MSTIIIPKPEWARYGDEFEFRWPTYRVTMKVSRLRERGESLTGEIAIRCDDHVVDICRVSLLTPRERSALANHLNGRSNGVAWGDMLTHVSAIVLNEYRREAPTEDTALGTIREIPYLIAPTLRQGVATAFYGDYATGKTTIAYAHAISVAYTVALPGGIEPLESGRVLILDYEMGIDAVRSTIRSLLRGLEIAPQPDRIFVRHLVHPLAGSAEILRTEVARLGIVLVVVDSQGQAMDTSGLGDAAAPVREMIRALESLGGVTSLIIGQVSKAESRRDGAREPYGSRAISYQCWDTWEFRGTVDEESHQLTTVMYHRKHRGQWYPPFAFTVDFPQRGVSLLKAGRIPNDPELASGDTQPHRILTFLVANGLATVKTIHAATGIADNTIRKVLSRLDGQGKAVKVGDQWGARTRVQEAAEVANDEG